MPRKKVEPTLKLMRHLLGSIDLSDIEDKPYRKDMSVSERKAYCAAIFAIFPRLEKDIKEFMYDQLLFMNLEAQDMLQVSIGRGTFNGFDLLLQHWKKAASEYESTPKNTSEEVDNSNPMPEL